MKTSDFSRYAVTICTASLLFTGCGQSQGQLGAPPTTLQNAAAQRGAVAGRLSRGDSKGGPRRHDHQLHGERPFYLS